jgi:tRNA-splicing ligase RtcB
MRKYTPIVTGNGGVIKAWVDGVPFDDNTRDQAKLLADMPFIHKWVSLMPDTHLGKGAAIGSVIATDKAIIPASVGVDIGCGMKAVKTNLVASDLPESLHSLRCDIESVIPVGQGRRDWAADYEKPIMKAWSDQLFMGFFGIDEANQGLDLERTNNAVHLGTLGGGNHFIEICLDEDDCVWIMLHSGSRGVGNAVGRYFISKAKEEMKKWHCNIPDQDLAYLPEGSKYFGRYIDAVSWAQEFARINRDIMMSLSLRKLKDHCPSLSNAEEMAVDCHHNYVQKENHYRKNVWVTRKGAVSAKKGELGIIPASMGEKSFIVRGLGNPESFCSCSHGAGRTMSRTKAKEVISLDDHQAALEGVECNNSSSTIDESPRSYKDIDAVMKAQDDLVEIVHELKQVLCIKG